MADLKARPAEKNAAVGGKKFIFRNRRIKTNKQTKKMSDRSRRKMFGSDSLMELLRKVRVGN